MKRYFWHEDGIYPDENGDLVKFDDVVAARCNDTVPVAPIGDAKLDSMCNEAMSQAQVFASAWSLVGGPFDDGDALETAEVEKLALRALISDLLAAVAAQGEKS